MDGTSETALDAFIDLAPETDGFLADVLEGLSRPRKRIHAKYFYDDAGSRLFERICTLEAYYPTRTEMAILAQCRGDLGRLLPEGATVVEFGSGSAEKIRLLVDGLRRPRHYVAIDISRRHLIASAEAFAVDHPTVRVSAICADFTDGVRLEGVLPEGPRIGFFPGSTIGNMTPGEATAFLRRVAGILGPDGVFVIGVDLKKDRRILEAAYDDPEGVTAAFNLNLLGRINRELEGTFDPDAFHHKSFYDPDRGRIEMHLVSRRAHRVTVADRPFSFATGETIHTENSHKYGVDEFRVLAAAGGFATVGVWTDPDGLFSVHCLKVA